MKRVFTLFVITIMSVMSCFTSMAAQTSHRDVVTVFGKQPQIIVDRDMTANEKIRKYFAIIAGDDGVLTNDEVTLEDGWRNGAMYQLLPSDGEPLVDYASDLTRPIGEWVFYEPNYPKFTIVYGNGTSDTEVYTFVKLPANMTAEQLGENAKYVINADKDWAKNVTVNTLNTDDRTSDMYKFASDYWMYGTKSDYDYEKGKADWILNGGTCMQLID